MKDSICFNPTTLGTPKGKYSIDLIDPRTRKVKERINGKNSVFPQTIFSRYGSLSFIVNLSMTEILTVLSNDDTAVDLDIPFIFDPIIGYGRPTTAGSGLYKGSYVAAEETRKVDYTSAYWKWQYEFTPAQANGVIKSIGLTNQYFNSQSKYPFVGFRPTYGEATLSPGTTGSSDGRYSYSCSTLGIVTIIDAYNNTSSTIDISSYIGNNTSHAKHIGIDGAGKMYVFVYSVTANDRKFYVFSDNTFTTLENTYTVTNITTVNITAPFFVYGNKVFSPASSSDYMHVCNFVTGEVLSDIALTPNPIIVDLGGPSNVRSHYGLHIKGGIVAFITSSSSVRSQSVLFDIINEQQLATFMQDNSIVNVMLYPFTQGNYKLPCWYVSNSEPKVNLAYTKSILPTPIEKTSSYSMVVTYELEIPWNAS